ncbi:LGFP repeat-containing protein [Gordonia sp. VNK21]|uniref:LGFP repeat-containing protein n=1 Tax=Gordonia sp. VNK21 TaxID=3382483 RepID=UPI0038D4E6F8
MTLTAHRRTGALVAGLAAAALVVAGCSDSDSDDATSTTGSSVAASDTSTTTDTGSASTSGSASAAGAAAGDVELTAEDGFKVTLSGPIAKKYASATEEQKDGLGKPLNGDHNAGTRDSGVVFQQFEGGVITAKNDHEGTPAYITWGRIRDAWNVERDADGQPSLSGKNGSAGPLGAVTSDEVAKGDLRTTTFEHGKITYNVKTRKTTVTVDGKVVKSGL